jgi:hypothetical protein
MENSGRDRQRQDWASRWARAETDEEQTALIEEAEPEVIQAIIDGMSLRDQSQLIANLSKNPERRKLLRAKGISLPRPDPDAIIAANRADIDAALKRYSGGINQAPQAEPSNDYEKWKRMAELTKQKLKRSRMRSPRLGRTPPIKVTLNGSRA